MKAFVKSNLKTKILRFFQVAFAVVICFTLAGCAGTSPDSPDWDTGINLEGVKVLRKPLSYSFDENVPENDGTTDFYYALSNDILTQLFAIYGNFNNSSLIATDENYIPLFDNILQQINSETNNAQLTELAEQFAANPDGFVYFYDAIRHQVTSVQQDAATGNYVVTTDTSRAWNWSITANIEGYPSLVYGLISNLQENGMLVSNNFTEEQFTYSYFNEYYTGLRPVGTEIFFPTQFQSAYVNEDYINGLTYAIYSLVLGLEPAAMTVDYTSGSPVLTVEGYAATADQTSAERALEEVKILFNQLGSYVGLTERNKTAITQFVLDEIIGERAQIDPTLPTPYSYDLYYEDVVSAIVDYCGTLTTIGQASEETGEGETTVGDSFMASVVEDYPATSFFTTFDEDPFAYVEPSEYQSLVLMPAVTEENPTIRITDMWLDFQYDANRDGNAIYDESLSIDIEVVVRWNKGDGSDIREVRQTITVVDGPADPGEDGTTLEFEFETLFGEVVEIGAFNCPAALTPPDGERVITLTGLTDARRYYKVMESSTYGGYGVLDESRIEGSYLEIAFNVTKTPGDTTTNYEFYTAISNLHEEAEWPGQPEWH